jgi:hypothetical protein
MTGLPITLDVFISNEQKIVVEARQKMGYETERLSNGYWRCFKGRHMMIINGCGYDTYTGVR